MEYRILYPEAFPMVDIRLGKGESVKAESDAMIAMSSEVAVEGKMEGGLFKGLVRKVFTKESFFLQKLVSSRNGGKVLIGHPLPGGIKDVKLDGSNELIVQKGGFLAATESIEIGSRMQGMSKGMFSGEGFFLLELSGRGTAFISSYGAIHVINLTGENDIIVDTGHLVAWDSSLQYTVKRASEGIIDSITSGEGLVCRFKGVGRIYIQSRNPESFSVWLKDLLNLKR